MLKQLGKIVVRAYHMCCRNDENRGKVIVCFVTGIEGSIRDSDSSLFTCLKWRKEYNRYLNMIQVFAEHGLYMSIFPMLRYGIENVIM